jgi:hypothetical protein
MIEDDGQSSERQIREFVEMLKPYDIQVREFKIFHGTSDN